MSQDQGQPRRVWGTPINEHDSFEIFADIFFNHSDHMNLPAQILWLHQTGNPYLRIINDFDIHVPHYHPLVEQYPFLVPEEEAETFWHWTVHWHERINDQDRLNTDTMTWSVYRDWYTNQGERHRTARALSNIAGLLQILEARVSNFPEANYVESIRDEAARIQERLLDLGTEIQELNARLEEIMREAFYSGTHGPGAPGGILERRASVLTPRNPFDLPRPRAPHNSPASDAEQLSPAEDRVAAIRAGVEEWTRLTDAHALGLLDNLHGRQRSWPRGRSSSPLGEVEHQPTEYERSVLDSINNINNDVNGYHSSDDDQHREEDANGDTQMRYDTSSEEESVHANPVIHSAYDSSPAVAQPHASSPPTSALGANDQNQNQNQNRNHNGNLDGQSPEDKPEENPNDQQHDSEDDCEFEWE